MKLKNYIFAAFALLLASCCCNSEPPMADFGYSWSFKLGTMESPFYEENASTEGWHQVDIPHDWSIVEGYTQDNTAGSNGFLPGGVGWYRKTIDVPAEWLTKKLFVRFEGVYNKSTVWINGKELGFFPNGYLDFEYDLTPYIQEGENTLTVRVDRRAYADSRWYVGGGIYRPVHLLLREKAYIPTHGQQITTPHIDAQNAIVSLSTEIVADRGVGSLDLEYDILFGGKSVTSEKQNVVLSGGDVVLDKEFRITSPQLWSLSNPNVYELRTRLLSDGKLLEEKTETFGIRTIEFHPSKGFLLNGEATKIMGVNIHHDLGCVGVALHDGVLYRRLKSMQDMGVNAIRAAHNPHSESMLNMCDTMGLLVMDEFVDEWRQHKDKWIIQRSKAGLPDSLQMGYSQFFDEYAERDTKNFVRRGFNNPSIVMWSIGNEIEWTYPFYFQSSLDRKGYKGLVFTGNPDVDGPRTLERFKELSKGNNELADTAHELASWVKSVDVTRPVTSGVVIPSVSRVSGYTDALDVIGYNYKDTYYESHHKFFPDKCIIGSENVGQYFEWAAVMDKPYIPGIFVWTGVDYLGENGPWPAKGGTYSFFDFACFKTSRGHFFECLWNDTPKTHIVTTPAVQSEFKQQKDGKFLLVERKDPLRRWLWYETFDKWKYAANEQVVVQVYTNAPKAELIVNGKSMGVRSRSADAVENVLLWQVPYVDGEIIAIGRDNNGREVSRYNLKTSGAVENLVATADNTKIEADGKSIVHVELKLEDKAGTLVVDDEQTITVEIDGKLKLLGVDNGSDTFVGNHQANSIVTNNGRALVILQSMPNQKGRAMLKFTSSGGQSASISVDMK